ncbi:MAG: nucleotidyltransferase domain-containing protein [Thermoleophilaceae bacterium]|jgi:predicted nucleotidyltransferase|nr:nucleotidyltransferase domain-containing protein [Thermoleophilaceae bacterium]
MPALTGALLGDRERKALDQFVDLLRCELGEDLVGAWLYGSRARGEATHCESDIDVMVVTRGGRRRDLDRVLGAALQAERLIRGEGTVLAPFVADPEWIAGRRAIGSFFMQEVDRDKLVLVGAP